MAEVGRSWRAGCAMHEEVGLEAVGNHGKV